MGNDDLWTQTDVGEKYNMEGMRMNHTAGNRRIFHRYSCFVSIEESRWGELAIAPVTNIGRSDIYFAISKSRPDIKDTLDSAMRRIRDDNPFYTDELYQRYFSAQTSAFLSSEEKEWLAQHGDIRIGYLNNDTGVSVLNQTTGKLTGVITDYIELAKTICKVKRWHLCCRLGWTAADRRSMRSSRPLRTLQVCVYCWRRTMI